MGIQDTVRNLLQGEPLRVISYGAIASVWLFTHAAYATGVTHSPPPDFDLILVAVSGAIATLTELARRLVYSPASVEAILSAAAEPPPVPVIEPTEEDPTPMLDAVEALDDAPADVADAVTAADTSPEAEGDVT